MNIKRQQAVLQNMQLLHDREKNRYRKLRNLFDNELMKQTELETEVRYVMKDYLSHIYENRMNEHERNFGGANEVTFLGIKKAHGEIFERNQ